MLAQVVELVGERQRHLDLLYLGLDPGQLPRNPCHITLTRGQLFLRLFEFVVPAVDTGAHAPGVDRRHHLDQRQQQDQQQQQHDLQAVDQRGRPERQVALQERRAVLVVAPGLGVVGVMLPYSPLHHLLLNAFGAALVATSANLSGEPVMTDAASVEQRLGGVAQAFLHHNRPIVRPADDPVYRTIRGRARPLRIGRGNAPLELRLPVELDRPVLAVGGHMKNTLCLAWGGRAVISPHIGDMGTARSLEVFEQLVADLQSLYGVRAEALICDRHPGYATTRWAQRQRLPCVEVQHHAAHAAALVGEQAGDSAPGDWLVFTWDGVGYGSDGELWGGEAVHGGPGRWRRVASMRPFRLPGGERAGREPWRSAVSLAWELGRHAEARRLVAQLRERADPAGDYDLLYHAWQRGLNMPHTSAVGRLFDAAAALTGVCRTASFEGQGPMWLEALAGQPARP